MTVCIDIELCKNCKLCMNICPKDVFAHSDKVNKKGFNYMEAVKEADCIRCKLCEKTCPDFAIYVK